MQSGFVGLLELLGNEALPLEPASLTELSDLDAVQHEKTEYLAQSREALKEQSRLEEADRDRKLALERAHEEKVFQNTLDGLL